MDRDGTILKHIHHLTKVAQAEIIQGVLDGCSLLKTVNFKFGIFTNQSVLGLGKCTLNEVELIHEFIKSEFQKYQIELDFIYVCPHKLGDGCSCRKPLIGMGIEAGKEFQIDFSSSYMIGDSISDVEFGDRLGMKTVFISSFDYDKATIVHGDFYGASEKILQFGKV